MCPVVETTPKIFSPQISWNAIAGKINVHFKFIAYLLRDLNTRQYTHDQRYIE